MKHEIPLQTAIEMTSKFQRNQPAGMPRCETFERASIDRLLNAPGAAKLRIYYGIKEGNEVHAILVAADAADHDLLPGSSAAITGDEQPPVILEDSFRCPPHCPPASPLNQD